MVRLAGEVWRGSVYIKQKEPRVVSHPGSEFTCELLVDVTPAAACVMMWCPVESPNTAQRLNRWSHVTGTGASISDEASHLSHSSPHLPPVWHPPSSHMLWVTWHFSAPACSLSHCGGVRASLLIKHPDSRLTILLPRQNKETEKSIFRHRLLLLTETASETVFFITFFPSRGMKSGLVESAACWWVGNLSKQFKAI